MNTDSMAITSCSVDVAITSSNQYYMVIDWGNGVHQLVCPDFRITVARGFSCLPLRKNSKECTDGYEVRRDS